MDAEGHCITEGRTLGDNLLEKSNEAIVICGIPSCHLWDSQLYTCLCLALGGASGTTFVPKTEVEMVEVGPLGDPVACWLGPELHFI